MKKILVILSLFLVSTLIAFADNKQEAIDFFNNYVNAANTYSTTVASMYSPDARIIRQVLKPDGTTVDVATDTATYIKQMKISQGVAKVRQYSNSYSNISAFEIDENTYKVSSLRQPKGETYKLKTYMIVKKQSSGNWLIIEEMMQTKEQIFLKYAKSN